MIIYNSKGKKINISDNSFIAEGGEGRLYGYKGLVYKIYLDESKLIPSAKLDELSVLDHESIIKPSESIFNANNKRIGFSMKMVPNAIALPRLFNSSYWNNHNITPASIALLVDKMQQTISYIHRLGFLQVDGNEFNYLVNQQLNKPYFIDVDSYQTASFPATAIMPSIRDYQQNEFNEGSDWFSFAIVAFQLFTGIHPFKGRHPDFKKGDFSARIKAGVSVFNKDVKYPSSVRDFSIIPANYLDWFKRLFEKNERISPPGNMSTMPFIAQTYKVIQDSKKLSIQEIASYPDLIKAVETINGQRIARTAQQVFAGQQAYDIPPDTTGVIMGPDGKPLFITIKDGIMGIQNSNASQFISSGLAVDRVFIAQNIPYIIRDDDLIEINIIELANGITLAPGLSRKILPNATTAFDGFLYENVLGKAHIIIPLAAGNMPIIRVTELDQLKVIDGRYENGVIYMVIADDKGEYKQLRLRFNDEFNDYDVELRSDIENFLNFTTLQKNIIVSIPEDGRLEVSSSRPAQMSIRQVEDAQISSQMRLYNDRGNAAIISANKIYSINLRT